MCYRLISNSENATDNFETFENQFTSSIIKGHQDSKFWFHLPWFSLEFYQLYQYH